MSRQVSIDVFKSQPLNVFQSLVVRKPFQFTFLYLKYFFVRLFDFTSLTLIFLFVLYYFFMKKLINREDIYNATILISVMFIFSLSPLVIAYAGEFAMFAQVILLHMIVIYIITLLLVIIYNKLLNIF